MTLAPEPWVWLARIRRPQGRKGEVFAEILTDFLKSLRNAANFGCFRKACLQWVPRVSILRPGKPKIFVPPPVKPS